MDRKIHPCDAQQLHLVTEFSICTSQPLQNARRLIILIKKISFALHQILQDKKSRDREDNRERSRDRERSKDKGDREKEDRHRDRDDRQKEKEDRHKDREERHRESRHKSGRSRVSLENFCTSLVIKQEPRCS